MRALGRACVLGALVAGCHSNRGSMERAFVADLANVDLTARSYTDAAVAVFSPQQIAACEKECLRENRNRRFGKDMRQAVCRSHCDPRPGGALPPYGAAEGWRFLKDGGVSRPQPRP
jgi:hypothetical protein